MTLKSSFFINIFFFLFKCLFSHSNFAVVVDVGSTGSRARVFEYEYRREECGNLGAVHLSLPEKTSKIRPGFSTFLDTRLQESSSITKQEAITEYLQRIKDVIDDMVPTERRSVTPIWILGTAGMRHFDPIKLSEILTIIRTIVADKWNEYKSHPDWIDVLDGEREGLYSWVVLNQLLDRQIDPQLTNRFINSPRTGPLKGKSVALIELGGASAQVVLQPPSSILSTFPDPPTLYQSHTGSVHAIPNHPGFVLLDFCNISSIVYSRSFLGFGRQLALQRYLALHEGSSRLPCLPSDVIFPAVNLNATDAMEQIGTLDDGQSVGIQGIVGGTFEICQKAVDQSIFGPRGNLTAEWIPLPFDIDNDTDIIGTENFYHFHRMVCVPDPSQPQTFSIETMHRRARELCSLKQVENIKNRLNPKAEFEKATTACFGLTYMAGFLEKVTRLSRHRNLQAIRKIDNIEASWPAGHILLELPHLISQYPHLVSSNLEHTHDEL